ncbi:putative phage tail component-like protein [Neobacillus niacini]|uniref:distal tail protein Dit n=1 Tax=Neobacillus driksii TaxID=3035913 RepID=UPI002780377C|nr:distal tail protein Dit [Neobacillus niacini]MDQ0976609.1 putative phage tail component-like protein [Neobacillus niacini]
MAIKFQNVTLPSYVKVTDIKYSILPSIDHKTEKIYGRAGTYDFGIELGERKIEVEIMLLGIDEHDVIKKARDFATYLFHKDLQPLILLDEPDKMYMARVSGETNIQELFSTGTATIVFICPSPYAESLTEKTVDWSPVDYTPITITNNGSAETYPVVDMTIKSDTTSIAILNAEKFVKVGSEDVVDKSKVAIDPLVLNDLMDTYTGWSLHNVVDGGVVAGALSSDGIAIKQTNGDYGTGTQWHGGSGIKTLTSALTDFQVTGRVQLSAGSLKQVGRVELYLLDTNNVVIGKVAMVDNASDGNYTKAEARAGSLASGHYFTNSYGSKKGIFADFNGIIQMSRIGQQWFAYFAKVDAYGKHHTKLSSSWFDSRNDFSTKQLAKVQIHIAGYGTHEPVSAMKFLDLKVYNKSDNVNYDTQIPIVFKAGDIVTIDNQKAIVLKNGQPIFTELDPSSDFFALERGANGLLVSPPVADVSIRYKERWL